MVKDKVGRHPDEHGMSKSVKCYAFSLQSFDTGSKDISFKFLCVIDSRMLSNRLLTDSRILGLHYGSEKVTRTNMIAIA